MENRSRFATGGFLSWDKEGREVLVVCVAGRFARPPAGRPSTQPLRVREVRRPPPPAGTYWGGPEHSSPRMEGQREFTWPGTGVYVSGHAWAPGGRPAREAVVGVSGAGAPGAGGVRGPRGARGGGRE
ncbi:DUF2169 domain-containing protein [Myxococcus sp. RHSTA-1-4]|uniref:DUF2169 domain-containing protein n=1 Tax=Myxococcus sp. RHSTA-1-4 TaxID=2874601 RepID=UPI001CBD7703|nr:DUF2169 domain-containing protein [Myxococcus sp. RHSTA-1-4]